MSQPSDHIDDEKLVSCDICSKQVPTSEATIPEAVDYFVHFCGPACYDKWQAQGNKPVLTAKPETKGN
jgi:hypothetical protein